MTPAAQAAPTRAAVVMGLVRVGGGGGDEYEVLLQGLGSVLYAEGELMDMLSPQHRAVASGRQQPPRQRRASASCGEPEGRLVLPHHRP